MYKEIIDKEIASSLKNGEQLKLSVWRSIKTEFVKFKTSGSNIELTDDKELQIINKMVQQRKDSVEQYKNAGRYSLANAEEQEMMFLQTLLPKEPTSDEIELAIKEYLSSKDDKPTMKDMKDVMSFVKTKYPVVNGGMVSKIFKEKYI